MGIEDLLEDANGDFGTIASTDADNEHAKGKVTCLCGECDSSELDDSSTISFQVFGVGAIRAEEIGQYVTDEMKNAMSPDSTDGSWDITMNRIMSKYSDDGEIRWAIFMIGSIFTEIKTQSRIDRGGMEAMIHQMLDGLD